MAGSSSKPAQRANRYAQIVKHIFESKYKAGCTQVAVERQDLKGRA